MLCLIRVLLVRRLCWMVHGLPASCLEFKPTQTTIKKRKKKIHRLYTSKERGKQWLCGWDTDATDIRMGYVDRRREKREREREERDRMQTLSLYFFSLEETVSLEESPCRPCLWIPLCCPPVSPLLPPRLPPLLTLSGGKSTDFLCVFRSGRIPLDFPKRLLLYGKKPEMKIWLVFALFFFFLKKKYKDSETGPVLLWVVIGSPLGYRFCRL